MLYRHLRSGDIEELVNWGRPRVTWSSVVVREGGREGEREREREREEGIPLERE